MKCPACLHLDSKVLDSRSLSESSSIRRRRECLSCGKRFTTFETVESSPILVVKNDGRRQMFDGDKIKRGLIRACEKRPVSIAQIENIVMEVEKQLQNSLEQEVKSTTIGKIVMQKLKVVDDVAYVRFASVYRKFADITHFMEFIKEFEDKNSIEEAALVERGKDVKPLNESAKNIGGVDKLEKIEKAEKSTDASAK